MAITLEKFAADCHAAIKNSPGTPGREKVCALVKEVLADPGFVATYIPELARADPAAFGVAVVTALGEALYFWWKMNVAPLRLLAFDFSLIGGVRPPWIVLLAGVALTLAGAAARRRWTALAAA